MAISVIEIPKVILSLSLESGGDLPDATTFYFTGFIAQGVGYYGGVYGEAADQVSITTTAANQRIRINWSYWHDSVLYEGVGVWDDLLAIMPDSAAAGRHQTSVIIKWDYYSMLDGSSIFYKWCNLNDPAISSEFQDTRGHRRWMTTYATPGIRADSGVFQMSSLPSNDYGHFNHGQIAWRYDNFNLYGPWPMDKGDLFFNITGTGNTLATLVDCIESADPSLHDRVSLSNSNDYSTTDCWVIIMKGSLCGTGELSLDRLNFSMVSSNMIHCPNITFTNCNIGDNKLDSYFWLNPVIPNISNSTYYHSGVTFIIDQIAAASNFTPWCRSGTTSYAAITGMYLADMPYHQWRYYKPTMPITDCTFSNTYLYATANSITHDYTGVNAIVWTNVQFLSPSTGYDVLFTYSYIGPGETGYDEINAYSLFVDRPDGLLRARFVNMETGDGADCIVNAFLYFNLKVKDNTGTEIVGAQITITDVDGTQYSDTTDINGDVSIPVKGYSVQWDNTDPDGEGNNSRTTIYSDMTLTISAAGYVSYIEAGINLTEDITKEIPLEEVQNVPEDGLTNLYEQEAARHLFLNEAIPNIGDAGGLQPSLTEGAVYVALLTANPGEQGSQANEAAYPGYARVAVPRVSGWTESNGEILNVGQINFPECAGASSEDITHYALMKEGSAGDMIAYGTLPESFQMYDTAQPQFGPFSLKFKFK